MIRTSAMTALALSAFVASVAMAAPLAPHDLVDLARRCGPDVDPTTTLAIIAHESGGRPYVVAVNAQGDQAAWSNEFDGLDAAAAAAEQAIGQGRSVDMGLMQINSGNLAALASSVRDALEPCRNVTLGTGLLATAFAKELPAGADSENEDGQEALARSLSRYNTGRPDAGLTNGYVAKVKRHAVPAITPSMPESPTLSPSTLSTPQTAEDRLKAAIEADIDVDVGAGE